MPIPALSLTAHRRPPARGGAPRRLVMFLHGYGADGQDLLGLAPYWAQALPDCAFVSPDAPFPCEMGFGWQWFGFQASTTTWFESRTWHARPGSPCFRSWG